MINVQKSGVLGNQTFDAIGDVTLNTQTGPVAQEVGNLTFDDTFTRMVNVPKS